MRARGDDQRRVVIVDGIGIVVEDHPVTDVGGLSAAELRSLSFHDPARAPVPPGGGTGPSEGSKATTVTPGAWHLARMHRALDDLPLNVLLLAKGNTVSVEGLAEQARAGAAGYKVHEDWGSTPAAIDAARPSAWRMAPASSPSARDAVTAEP